MRPNDTSIKRWRIAVVGAALMAAAGCGFLGGGPTDYEQKLSNREKLEKRGAKLQQQFHWEGNAWAVELRGLQITDEILELLRNIDHICELNFSGSTLTDEQLAKVDQYLSGVVLKIDLSDTAVSDAGIGDLKNFNVLREINLKGTKVTPEGILRFKTGRKENPGVMLKTVKIIVDQR